MVVFEKEIILMMIRLVVLEAALKHYYTRYYYSRS